MDIRAVKFRVGREWRVGGLYLPSKPGPSPAVLMLHGFPGVLQNEDIAAELCRRGLTVLMPHYRGCWGSSGEFSIPGMSVDALAAFRLLARYHHVDKERIAVLGYSLGGWIALRLAARRRFAAVAVMAPAWPRDDRPADAEYLRRSAKVLNAPRLARVWRDYLDAARRDSPYALMPRISPAPLLLVQGLKDRLVPPSAAAKLYALAREPKTLLELPDEAHEFLENRRAVVAAVSGWLAANLRAGPVTSPASSFRAPRRIHAARR